MKSRIGFLGHSQDSVLQDHTGGSAAVSYPRDDSECHVDRDRVADDVEAAPVTLALKVSRERTYSEVRTPRRAGRWSAPSRLREHQSDSDTMPGAVESRMFVWLSQGSHPGRRLHGGVEGRCDRHARAAPADCDGIQGRAGGLQAMKTTSPPPQRSAQGVPPGSIEHGTTSRTGSSARGDGGPPDVLRRRSALWSSPAGWSPSAAWC
jgi:hypothetical protein